MGDHHHDYYHSSAPVLYIDKTIAKHHEKKLAKKAEFNLKIPT